MTSCRLAALVVIAASGCRGTPPAPPGEVLPASPAGLDRALFVEELDVVIDLAGRACACLDEACALAVDAELATYARRAILDDAVTEAEAWPEDLDALGQAQFSRLVRCMVDRHHVPQALGVFDAREVAALRDAACACADAPCAARVQARMTEEEAGGFFVADDATRAERDAAASELHDCLLVPFSEQTVLDMKQLRDRACACEDEACRGDVRAAATAWSAANGTWIVSSEARRVLWELAKEMRACMTGP